MSSYRMEMRFLTNNCNVHNTTVRLKCLFVTIEILIEIDDVEYGLSYSTE